MLYNWWATPTTFDCVVLELLGLPWRGGFNVDFVHYMATSTSSTSSSTLVCGTLGTTVSTASVFVDLVYYKLVDGVCCGTSPRGAFPALLRLLWLCVLLGSAGLWVQRRLRLRFTWTSSTTRPLTVFGATF